MDKLKIIAFLLFCMGYGSIQAQSPDSDLVSGNALIYKDPRIDYLLKVYAAKNAPKLEVKNIYRIQILSSKSRTEVNDAKAKFSAKYPGVPVFMSFDPPTFKLRAGTFLSREDASTFLREIRKVFPASFVVQ